MKKQHVQLTQTDRDDLETLISKGKMKARSYRRALGLLELDRGKTYTVVAETLERVMNFGLGVVHSRHGTKSISK